MGKITGFLEIDRQDRKYLPAADRIRNYNEFVIRSPRTPARPGGALHGLRHSLLSQRLSGEQPDSDWNDLVIATTGRSLSQPPLDQQLPEFTGRICPAPCEASCTLNLTEAPVTIKTIECAIVDRGWKEGWIAPQRPAAKTGKKVAIVGAGPAGLAAAQQLSRRGHEVHVFERQAKAGGLLRYGIPDFKMEKHHIDRRIAQMEKEGTIFHYGVHVGVNKSAKDLDREFDAVLLTGGAEKPRDLEVDGRELSGVHFAMEFLPQQNRRVSDEPIGQVEPILAGGKHVVVIGGGDTGSDCIGTSFRQGAVSVTQLEIMPAPPEKENKLLTWPDWPLKMRTSSSQAEGATRDFAVMTRRILGKDGHVRAIECVRVDEKMQAIPGSEFEIKADLVLLAMGFVHPVHEGMLADLGLQLDKRGNVAADTATYKSSLDKIFAAGDMRRGQSLVVWAIREGRQAAREVDLFLMGETTLPR